MKTANITCRGRVQGVFYRASTRDKAIELGLRGFVRNELNGDVFVCAQGSDDKIDQLVHWCRSGPPLAQVSNVELVWVDIEEVYSSFSVSYR